MTRYIVLYRAPLDVAQRFATATPEEAQLGMQAWIDWSAELGDALLDPGKPLGNTKTVTMSGTTDGGTDVIGMSILQAESLDAALAMVQGHHHLRWAEGTEITVLEEMGIPELDATR